MEPSSWGNFSPLQGTFVRALVAGYFGEAWPMCHLLAVGGEGKGWEGGACCKGSSPAVVSDKINFSEHLTLQKSSNRCHL